MKKTFTINLEIQDRNTPQKWEFSKEVTGIEQLALWVILKELAEKQIRNMLANPNN